MNIAAIDIDRLRSDFYKLPLEDRQLFSASVFFNLMNGNTETKTPLNEAIDAAVNSTLSASTVINFNSDNTNNDEF